ncbi:MAG: ribonuclease P protein component [Gammaproteobacteria bacterium]|nr:ribonuclease P protein component [Gammaproteobacteria bacterium]
MCSGSKRFPGRVRLTGPDDYQRVFKHCRFRVSNRWLTVLATPNQLQHPRLGLAISRKVARTAVARNRIKRVIRESYRHWQQRLGVLDIVVLGRSGIAGRSKRDLNAAVEKLWIELIKQCAGSSFN